MRVVSRRVLEISLLGGCVQSVKREAGLVVVVDAWGCRCDS
jgi:hypothetical protein